MICYFLGVNTVNVPINRNHVYKWTLFEMTLTPGTAVCTNLYPSAFIELKQDYVEMKEKGQDNQRALNT